jgi:hypothetical protein
MCRFVSMVDLARCRLAAVLVVLGVVGALALPRGATARDGVFEVISDTGDHIVAEVLLEDSLGDIVDIDGQPFVRVVLDGEAPLVVAGAPEVPSVTRSLLIPDDAHMTIAVTYSEYREISDIDVAPSRGVISRQIDPADVPYTFGPEYDTDAFYPGDLAVLGEPFIMRDYRGVVLDVYPYQYNPVTRVLRIYEELVVEVIADGPGLTNVLQRAERPESLAFYTMASHRFANADPTRYPPSNEQGEMLIICHDDWLSNIQPLVDHKNGIGIPTTVVAASTVGSSTSAIEDYLQAEYDGGNLAFVLLVGDSAQITTTTRTSSSAVSPPSRPPTSTPRSSAPSTTRPCRPRSRTGSGAGWASGPTRAPATTTRWTTSTSIVSATICWPTAIRWWTRSTIPAPAPAT